MSLMWRLLYRLWREPLYGVVTGHPSTGDQRLVIYNDRNAARIVARARNGAVIKLPVSDDYRAPGEWP